MTQVGRHSLGMSNVSTHVVTTRVAAERLGISVRTVNRWVELGKLKPAYEVSGKGGFRVFDVADIDAIAAERAS